MTNEQQVNSDSFNATLKFSEKAIYSLIWISGGCTLALLVFIEKIYGHADELIIDRITDALLLCITMMLNTRCGHVEHLLLYVGHPLLKSPKSVQHDGNNFLKIVRS